MTKDNTAGRTFCLCLCTGLALSGYYLATRHALPEPAVVGISAGGLTLDGKRIELNQLRKRLKENTTLGRSIAIQADKGATLEGIIEVMDAAKSASKVSSLHCLQRQRLSSTFDKNQE